MTQSDADFLRCPAPSSTSRGSFFCPLLPNFAIAYRASSGPVALTTSKGRASRAFTCKHGKYKDSCKLCPGKYFCTHMSREASSGKGRRKRDCKKCGSMSYCKHGTMRKICKESECLPYAYMLCVHTVRKDSCNICARCDHGRVKKKCITCSPHLFCEHGKNKYSCTSHPKMCPHKVKWFKKCCKCLA